MKPCLGILFFLYSVADVCNVQSQNIVITHQMPSSISPGEEFTAKLTIKKGSISGFAKIQIELPSGLKATEGETKNANFTFQNQVAKFIWMTLPSENEFGISYKVSVAGNASGTKIFTGTFAYVDSNERKTSEIPQKTIVIKAMEPAGVSAKTEKPERSGNKDILLYSHKSNTKYAIHNKQEIEYSVQIAASYKKYLDPNFLKEHNITDIIFSEFNEGLSKFSLGSFNSYKAARDLLTRVRTLNGIDGAFVIAYNNGTRISVTEALTGGK